LVPSFSDSVLERAAGVGQGLLISRVACAATLAGRGTPKACVFVKIFEIYFVVIATALPSGTARSGNSGKGAVIWIMEISIDIRIYGCWRR
jgi:hypothetical protein